MSGIDVARFKAALPELTAKRRIQPGPRVRRASGERLEAPRAVNSMLRNFYQKAGVDVAKLDELAARVREDGRRRFDEEKAAAAKALPSTRAAFQQGVENRATALKLLAKPFVTYYEILPQPFLIWETPHAESGVFIDSHVAAQNSWAKVLVNTDSRSDSTIFNFYFYWENPSDYYALMNVSSWLFLNGACQAAAASGFFSGDSAYLTLDAELAIWRWIGWGTDSTGASLDQTLVYPVTTTPIANLSVTGGDFFSGGTAPVGQNFAYNLYDLSYDFLAVPPNASVVFEVGMGMSYGFGSGGNDGDNIYIDFSFDKDGYQIICQEVLLEMLTPLDIFLKSR